MNKKFFEFIFKLILLACIIWAVFAIISKNFGMYIFDEEYASYKQTLDYVNNKTNDHNDVLIVGDSVAKAGVLPELLSENAYNISMAGATTIEQYYIMEDYLQNHEPPKALIMMYFIGANDSIDDFFWNRTVYFDCLTTGQFNEILDNGAFTNEKLSAKFNFLQYKLGAPNKYYAAIKNGIFQHRYHLNKKEYETSQLNKGHHYFGTAEFYESNNVTITGKQSFQVLPIIDVYMNKCIEQCEENGIKVIIEQHPINASTFANMNTNYKQEYMDYMKSLAGKYPNIIVNTEYTIGENNWFGDFSHLNEKGATEFSKILKEKYSQYF